MGLIDSWHAERRIREQAKRIDDLECRLYAMEQAFVAFVKKLPDAIDATIKQQATTSGAVPRGDGS